MEIAHVEQRVRWCRGKISHLTPEAAAKHAAGRTKKNQSRGRPIPDVPVVYFCATCKAFHFGHQHEEHRP